MIFDENMMRKDRRFDSMNLADVEIYDLLGNGVYKGIGKTLNLSLGGLLFEIYDDSVQLDMNYDVIFMVSLEKEGEIIQLEGNIKWLQRDKEGIKIGVQFKPLKKHVYDKLKDFLNKLLDENE